MNPIRNLRSALVLQVPDGFADDAIQVTYTDPYGRTLVDAAAEVEVVAAEPGPDPAITSGTERAFAGRLACVCGRFPEPRHWTGLHLDGRPVGVPLSASGRVVSFELPAGLAPGSHLVTGDPVAGYGDADHWAIQVLQMAGSLDQEQLFSGGSTTMRLRLLGSDEPLPVRIRNQTPAVISIEGGEEQVVTTSGGDDNGVERPVRAVGRGGFAIQWELAAAWCPCAGR